MVKTSRIFPFASLFYRTSQVGKELHGGLRPRLWIGWRFDRKSWWLTSKKNWLVYFSIQLGRIIPTVIHSYFSEGFKPSTRLYILTIINHIITIIINHEINSILTTDIHKLPLNHHKSKFLVTSVDQLLFFLGLGLTMEFRHLRSWVNWGCNGIFWYTLQVTIDAIG